MMADTNVKFVSQKISKIRWRPASKQIIQESDTFATGSWDNVENKVCIWSLASSSSSSAARDGPAPPQDEPKLLCQAAHEGDVTDLRYLGNDHLLTASSTGTVVVYKHHKNSQTLGASQSWDRLHHHGNSTCPCTAIATKGDDCIATVGEDGRINVLNLEQRNPIRTIERADSCTLNAITFLKQFEVITVNTTGQLKVWDLRQPADEPAKTYLLAGERVPLHCIDKHPNQPHIVATGGQDGMLCIWDMRQDRFPVTLLDAHSADMWEMKFHPSHPDNLFTCSEDGSVWHWDGTSVNSGHSATLVSGVGSSFSKNTSLQSSDNSNSNNPWLSSDASKHRIEITNVMPDNLMPVNSIDIEGNTLLCGTDGEAIYSVRHLSIS